MSQDRNVKCVLLREYKDSKFRADRFLAPWAKAKLYTSFESASVGYECLKISMAWWQFHIAIHHSENDSFAS